MNDLILEIGCIAKVYDSEGNESTKFDLNKLIANGVAFASFFCGFYFFGVDLVLGKSKSQMNKPEVKENVR